jgi:hypothetical protein
MERVTFRHYFTIPGLDGSHGPGTYEVHTEREALDVSWPAYRLTTTILLTGGGRIEAIAVKRGDLDAALQRDAAQ